MKRKKWLLGGLLVSIGVFFMMIPLMYSFQGEMYREKMLREFDEQIKEITNSDIASVRKDEENEVKKNKEQKAKAPMPTGVLGMIEIDSLDISYPIVEGVGSNELRFAIGHMPETADIGGMGNCLLAGHRGGRYGAFFKYLDQIKIGANVRLIDPNGNEFLYEVMESYVTHPYDQRVKNQSEQAVLTLLTCETKGTMRMVVRCKKKGDSLM